MRLHRSPAHPFQRGQLLEILNSGLYSELTEASNFVRGTYSQCCGKSYAASAASDLEETKKVARRVPKGERKLMVESYVKKFKAMNDGKLPTVSDARREVGGSFYILREILQELKYNSSAPLKGTGSAEEVNVKKDEILTDTEGIIRTKEASECEQISKVDSTVSITESHASEERAESSCRVQDIRIDDVQLPSSVNSKSKDSEVHPRHRISGLESSTHSDHESKLHCDSLADYEVKVKKKESDGSEREPKVPNEENEPQRSTSMWQNLKSFASGILGIWRRS